VGLSHVSSRGTAKSAGVVLRACAPARARRAARFDAISPAVRQPVRLTGCDCPPGIEDGQNPSRSRHPRAFQTARRPARNLLPPAGLETGGRRAYRVSRQPGRKTCVFDVPRSSGAVRIGPPPDPRSCQACTPASVVSACTRRLAFGSTGLVPVLRRRASDRARPLPWTRASSGPARRASRPCTGCGRACTDPCKPQVSTDARPSCTPSCTPVALTPCADRRCTPFGPNGDRVHGPHGVNG